MLLMPVEIIRDDGVDVCIQSWSPTQRRSVLLSGAWLERHISMVLRRAVLLQRIQVAVVDKFFFFFRRGVNRGCCCGAHT